MRSWCRAVMEFDGVSCSGADIAYIVDRIISCRNLIYIYIMFLDFSLYMFGFPEGLMAWCPIVME